MGRSTKKPNHLGGGEEAWRRGQHHRLLFSFRGARIVEQRGKRVRMEAKRPGCLINQHNWLISGAHRFPTDAVTRASTSLPHVSNTGLWRGGASDLMPLLQSPRRSVCLSVCLSVEVDAKVPGKKRENKPGRESGCYPVNHLLR